MSTVHGWRRVLRANQIGRDVAHVAGQKEAARQMAFELAPVDFETRIRALAILASQAARGHSFLPRVVDVEDQLDRMPTLAGPRVQRPVHRSTRKHQGRLPVDLARAVPIAAVFDRLGITVHRHGRLMVAACPFHDDRRPSLTIDPRKNVWFCQVCQIGGDGIRLVERIEKRSFADAVRRIAA